MPFGNSSFTWPGVAKRVIERIDVAPDGTSVTLHAAGIRSLVADQAGRWGAIGYANPALDQLIERIDAELISYARDAAIEEAWRMILDDVVIIPLHGQMIVGDMRDDLDLPVSPLNSPSFSRARLN